MSKNSSLSHRYNRTTASASPALTAYETVFAARQKDAPGTKEQHEAHFVQLAPYMSNLDQNTDLTKKDKKRFYRLFINILSALGDIDAAIQCSEKALKFDDRDPKVLLKHAGLLRENNRAHEAISYFQLILRMKPDGQEALLGIASTYEDIGEIGTAMAYLQKAAREFPLDQHIQTKLSKLATSPAP